MTSERFGAKEFDVVAERTYVGNIDDKSIEVRVRFGRPVPHPEGGWFCPYLILGVGDEIVRAIGGVDSVQALQLAMYMAGTDLRIQSNRIKLTFLGENDIGLPATTQEATGSSPDRKSSGASC